MKSILLFLSIALLAGCIGTRPTAGGSLSGSSLASEPYSDPEILTRSLFDFQDRTISEEDIQRLLDGRIDLPDTLRIALLNYGSNTVSRYYNSYWSNEEFLKLKQGYIDAIRDQLRSNPRIAKIILMPELLMGHNPNIFTLREAAVRLQADVLFIFSLHSDIYYDYKTFRKDEAKAFATCEALLMDIRTGVIPFSEVVSRDALARKSPADANETELRKRAENEAVSTVLPAIAERLNEYLRTER